MMGAEGRRISGIGCSVHQCERGPALFLVRHFDAKLQTLLAYPVCGDTKPKPDLTVCDLPKQLPSFCWQLVVFHEGFDT